MQVSNGIGLRPVEFFVVVELDPDETVTKGGIILPLATTERDKLAAQMGTLVAASPHAFSYARREEWPPDTIPQVGQRVMFKKYDGSLYRKKIDGKYRDFKLLNDKSIIAVVEDEETSSIREAA